jgi:hypothetical protein
MNLSVGDRIAAFLKGRRSAMARKPQQWQLQRGVKMSEDAAAEVAKIACALKSLSVFTGLVLDQDDCPEDLQRTVDEGVAAIDKLFIW